MNYTETVNWMFGKLPVYQRQGKSAYKNKLDGILEFSNYLGNPHYSFKTIHVAGTNGKGSTSHMMASILQEAGYKVGLYTSPHLKDFRERIKINGKEISQEKVVTFINNHKGFLEKKELSFFEMTVGMAFGFFADQKVDIAVVEVGLGGRLDSTNIIQPEVSVITNIGMDHTDMLGDTLTKIAYEKAGIIKESTPVVIGEQHPETYPVFLEIAKEKNATVYLAEEEIKTNYLLDLKGNYQSKKSKAAVKAMHLLKGFDISEEHIQKGLNRVIVNTGLRGRWEILDSNPRIICDTAHNREGLLYVMQQLKKETYDQLYIVLGVVNDKNLDEILTLFPEDAIYYFCKPDIPRGLDASVLKKSASKFNLSGDIYQNVKEAFVAAKIDAQKDDLIYIGGSTFVVAEIL